MRKTKNLSRVLSMILAFCLSVALLPAQALAATKNDDPTTWPAPDSIYTAPDKNPVYLMVDFTDEDNGGVAASHYCASGATLTADIVKATATTGGHVKYICDTCGSWAQINVPALTLSAFTLDPAYTGIMSTGVEYSGNAYTVVYDVAPAFRRYVGTKLDNHVSVTAPGSYGIVITVDSAIYDNVELNTAERLLVLPKAIPWTATFDSKIYDGNSLLDGKTVTYLDVNGASVPAALSACQVKVENGELTVDTSAPVTRPVAAGPYAIGATITDNNYVWQTEDGKFNTVYTLVWIFPATNQIYVGDTVQAVKLTTGNTVSDLDGLQVALAEIDENFVRKDLSDDEFRELLLRRKEIYESLHPETKRGGDRSKRTKCPSAPVKSFADDTADKWGVDPRTVRREIQTAKNLTTEAKTILRDSDTKLTKKDALSLSRLTPEQQREAASRLAAGDIDSMNEYQPPPAVLGPTEPEEPAEAPPPSVPYSSSGRHFATIEESIADLKNPDKDCSYTPDSLLAELDSFIEKFHREFEWYNDPFCTVVFPDISQVQFDYIQKRFGTISTAIHDLLQQMKRSMKK